MTEALDFFNMAIISKKLVDLKNTTNDSTGFNPDFKSDFSQILPIKIIFHRNNFFLGCYSFVTKSYFIFEISMINKFSLSKLATPNSIKISEEFQVYFKTLFGVSKNINNRQFRIKLEVSSATAIYIKQFVWHHSQRFKKNNNTVILELECGLNRELVGWIFSWMNNMKIIEPKELKAYYIKTLKEINKTEISNLLVYKNIFNSLYSKKN